jgi:hypothetical protein
MRDYYQPRLLQRLLARDVFKPVRSLASLNRVQPLIEVEKVEWEDAARGFARVTVIAKDNQREQGAKRPNSGVYDLRLFRDKQLVGWEPKTSMEYLLQPAPPGPDADEMDRQWWRQKTPLNLDSNGAKRLTFTVQIPRRAYVKQVTFTAYAFNIDRVKSATASTILNVTPGTKSRAGKAYVISVGVNRTESSPHWDLQFAANDARQMSEVVGEKLQATGQFREVVRIRLVSEEAGREQPGEGTATKAHLKTVLDLLAGSAVPDAQRREIPDAEKIEKAEPEDLVLLTFSSHGYADERGVFHMILADTGKNLLERLPPGL